MFLFLDFKFYEKVPKNLTIFGFIVIITYVFILFLKIIMTKKEYLIKILEQLESVRELAPGMKILVEQWALWDNVINTLITTVENWIHSVKSEMAKQKMKKWLDMLEKMKQIEVQSAMQDEKDLVELDKLISNF